MKEICLLRHLKIHNISEIFQNSYSANRGKRDISEEEEKFEEDEFDELMAHYFNPFYGKIYITMSQWIFLIERKIH